MKAYTLAYSALLMLARCGPSQVYTPPAEEPKGELREFVPTTIPVHSSADTYAYATYTFKGPNCIYREILSKGGTQILNRTMQKELTDIVDAYYKKTAMQAKFEGKTPEGCDIMISSPELISSSK